MENTLVIQDEQMLSWPKESSWLGNPAVGYSQALSSSPNQLLSSADKLFSVIAQLKSRQQPVDTLPLYQYLYKELNAFQNLAKRVGYNDENILLARYLLCSCLDVAIQEQPNEINTEQVDNSLVAQFQQKTLSEEKLFAIIQKLSHAPALFIDLIELTYVCLRLGLAESLSQGSEQRKSMQAINNSLYQLIRTERGEIEKNLSKIINVNIPPQQSIKKSIGKLVAVVISVLAITYGGVNYLLKNSQQQIGQQLTAIIDKSY